MWTQTQINAHKDAAAALTDIMMSAFRFIRGERKSLTEFDVNEYIYGQFLAAGLRFGRTFPEPIVAFGENTSIVHYIPTKKGAKCLRPDMPVLIDIWGKLGGKKSPFADITWFGYRGGSVPEKIQQTFAAIIFARDLCIKCIRREIRSGHLPTGKAVDKVAQDMLRQGARCELGHELGHSLGTGSSPHGLQWLAEYDEWPLCTGCAYTIEPGVYFDGDFGVRSEMDFLITPESELEITTGLQKEIVLL